MTIDNKVFIDTGDYHKLGHIGWGGTNQQFFMYIEGYKSAGDSLIDSAILSKDVSILDTFVYPALFLYRQFLELQLKEVFLLYAEDSENKKEKFIKKAGHNLQKMWLKIKPLVASCAHGDDEHLLLNQIEEMINEYSQFDKSSFAFRYPIHKDLTKVFVEDDRIDLEVVRNCMNEIYTFFFGVTSMLGERQEQERDMREYYGY